MLKYKASKSALRIKYGQEIINEFIENGSEKEINLSYDARKQILTIVHLVKRMKELPFPMPNGKVLPGNGFCMDDAVILGDVVSSVISSNCFVEENVKISNSLLMSGCKISPDSIISNSVLGQNVVIGNGAKLDNVVIGDDVVIAAKMDISDQRIP